jgi:peroxiredoxin
MKKINTLMSVTAMSLVAAMGLSVAMTPAVNAEASAAKLGVDVGEAAPNFTLSDTDGNELSLADYTKDGKIVVLEWFNPGCPFVKKHYSDSDNQTMNLLADKYKGQDVVWLAINSGAEGKQGAGLELNKQIKKDWGIEHPILLDETGQVGKLYGATRTPEMFIINAEGTIVYHGAICNDSSAGKPGDVKFVEQALDQVLAGESVTTAKTRPYGCSVKYGS